MDDRLISLEAAVKELENLNIASFYELNEHSKEVYMEVKAMLKALPPADTIPAVRGRWIGDANSLRCSVCNRDLMDYFSYTEDGQIVIHPDFCPNCGADMRKDSDDNG